MSKARVSDSRIRAILGPTNTGKTHLAIERMCGHSSGAIGFPLRLLAREVFDKVRAIKGDAQVALITGEERIEPPNARYLLCTAEAMPRNGGDRAFVALDEAQLCADRERGHIFTDRLLNARGRDETMFLGSATLEAMVRALIPGVSIEQRPRFSTLSHAGTAKLSRLPPRSAIVAFSIEEVYRVAELLKRFRGGAAVVMGALSPETRNRQVELFQSGEVDYIVATDAIGMGLNLDVAHVAFASLSKFDGVRQRRLIPAEMAQIAGRAGRHQKDGTFGTLAGGRGKDNSFTDEEIYAIEQHRFAPLTQLYWREAEPRFGSLDQLIGDLESRPDRPQLAAAPEAIDLAVLKRLADDPAIHHDVTSPAQVRRLWDVCQLPDFRQQGAEMHARFVARLWGDLRGKDGSSHLGADYVAARIAELAEVRGDIDTLQGRLAAIRSWAYICQRPDWVLARDEMAARARAVEARLSDALHQRLTERFVNRRTSILMKSMGKDAGLLRVTLEDNGQVLVEGQVIGHLDGFRFVVDADASSEDRKLMLAAAEKYLPALLAQKARTLVTSELGDLTLGCDADGAAILRDGRRVAKLEATRNATRWRLVLDKELAPLDQAQRTALEQALEHWLEGQLAPLAPLRGLEEASQDPEVSSEVRALVLALIERHGVIPREQARLASIDKEQRPLLRELGVLIGALDVYVPALLKPGARKLLHDLGLDPRPLNALMFAVVTPEGEAPAGYRRAGAQAIRVDMAEKLIRAAHDSRVKAGGKTFRIDEPLSTSLGLVPDNLYQLLRSAGFRPMDYQPMPEGMFGPPNPRLWSWRPPRKDHVPGGVQNQQSGGRPQKQRRPKPADHRSQADRAQPKPDASPPGGGAFAGLADLLR